MFQNRINILTVWHRDITLPVTVLCGLRQGKSNHKRKYKGGTWQRSNQEILLATRNTPERAVQAGKSRAAAIGAASIRGCCSSMTVGRAGSATKAAITLTTSKEPLPCGRSLSEFGGSIGRSRGGLPGCGRQKPFIGPGPQNIVPGGNDRA